MVSKDDVLVYRVKTEDNKYHLMLALEDEVVFGKGIRIKELNDWVSKETIVPPTEMKIVGHVEPGASNADIVGRFLPEKMWQYTPALYRQNVMKNQTRITGSIKKNKRIDHKQVRTDKQVDLESDNAIVHRIISTYQCARLLKSTKAHVRKLLDSGKVDYHRDDNQVFRISLESVLQYASISHALIDEEYYAHLTRQIAENESLTQHEQIQSAADESFPSDKAIWRVGMAIAQRFKNHSFLEALYNDDRLADMMFRYFSGDTLEQIGGSYGLSRERARQLCEKGLSRLMAKLSYFTKETVEKKGDREADPEEGNKSIKPVGDSYDLIGMGFSNRAMTVFRQQGIYSLDQLTQMSRQDLIRLPNIGRKTLNHIIKVLGRYDLEPKKAP